MLLRINSFITALLLAIAFTGSVNATSLVHNTSLCLLEVAFESEVQKKQQTINLNNNVKMSIANLMATQSVPGARMATNVGCQKLDGASYTGSKQEWVKFFNSAVSGMVKEKYQKVSFTLVGDTEKVYRPVAKANFITKEYIIRGAIKDNQQVIMNLAILDKPNNTLYTFSVSGSALVETEIAKEFQRLLASLEPLK